MWKLLTVITGKLIIFGLKLFKRHATALPGLIAGQMHPHLLRDMVKDIKGGVIIVTGTNGKTTTAKVLRKILESQGQRVLANRSGSNFTRGILSSLIEHARWNSRLDYDIAVLEVDEAYTPLIAKEVQPVLTVVLNVMRDQLDRYGEIDHTVRTIGNALQFSKGAVLNADDSAILELAKHVSKTTTFGVSEDIRPLLPSDHELHGGHKRKAEDKRPDVYLESFAKGENTTTLQLGAGNKYIQTATMLEGVHSFANITAALAAIYHLQGSLDQVTLGAISEIKPAFGRGERLMIDDIPLHLALIKNPGGFNQNMRSFLRPEVSVVLFIINDRYADGRDVSWLWDVDLSTLKNMSGVKVITSGVRAFDMALRLQQEDIPILGVEPKIPRALLQALNGVEPGREVLVLPTYTAMLETRKLLLKKQTRHELWR